MIQKSFFGLSKPKLNYDSFEGSPLKAKTISPLEKISLLIKKTEYILGSSNKNAELLKKGDSIIKGQKLTMIKGSDEYAISTVSGTISDITSFIGNYGQTFYKIEIQINDNNDVDDNFLKTKDKLSIEHAIEFLQSIPGLPDFQSLKEKEIDTIVINCVDNDLMVTTKQYFALIEIDNIKKGVGYLKQITGISKVILALPEKLIHSINTSNLDTLFIESNYPSANPFIITEKIVNKEIPAQQTPEDLGIFFISSEAAAAIGKAYETGQIPFTKTLTIVKKDNSRIMVSAVIGTSVYEVLNSCSIDVNENDRVIFNGPLTGTSIYSLSQPIEPNTDAIIVQDKDDLSNVTDSPCINCGECIRICPCNVPVNLLVRFLEAKEYQEAADIYDLYSCIECGLCSYVCTVKMPVLQYIKLAKFELSKTDSVDEPLLESKEA